MHPFTPVSGTQKWGGGSTAFLSSRITFSPRPRVLSYLEKEAVAAILLRIKCNQAVNKVCFRTHLKGQRSARSNVLNLNLNVTLSNRRLFCLIDVVIASLHELLHGTSLFFFFFPPIFTGSLKCFVTGSYMWWQMQEHHTLLFIIYYTRLFCTTWKRRESVAMGCKYSIQQSIKNVDRYTFLYKQPGGWDPHTGSHDTSEGSLDD